MQLQRSPSYAMIVPYKVVYTQGEGDKLPTYLPLPTKHTYRWYGK
jgi:hypothetical protein